MTAISFKNVSKFYRSNRSTYRALSDEVHHLFTSLFHRKTKMRKSPGNFHALSNVSFDIKPGESVGFLGSNGAGKTTIMRLIANITKPTSGKVTVRGRIAPLIEIGAGFHPELTGRENVYLNGVILGMSKKDVARKFDQIVSFSELEPFIDSPIKQYSSGMYMRLGFSVAVHSDFDILLADEILAVGDQSFREKCFGKFEEIKNSGKTLVLVSHSIDQLKKHCKRGIWLDKGLLHFDGEIDSVCTQYLSRLKTHG